VLYLVYDLIIFFKIIIIIFYEHVQVGVTAISNRNCLIFSLWLCAIAGAKTIILIIFPLLASVSHNVVLLHENSAVTDDLDL